MEATKPRTAIETLILVNQRRIEAVEDALRREDNLIMSKQLQEDVCALIVTIKEYNSFLKDIYEGIPDEANNIQ